MGATVGVNGHSVVHKKSGGVSTAVLDVCKRQAGPAVVPLPLLNIAESANLTEGTKKVTCDNEPVGVKDSVITPTRGDEAGDLGGVVSGKTKGKAQFASCSLDVKFEGQPVVKAFDVMKHNENNTMLARLVQGPVKVMVPSEEVRKVCVICGEEFE